jgi:RHS repeat-associated protein
LTITESNPYGLQLDYPAKTRARFDGLDAQHKMIPPLVTPCATSCPPSSCISNSRWQHEELTASDGTNGIWIFESGTYRGNFGTYGAGDKFRVAVESGAVKYYKISGGTQTLLYTSTVTPAYPLVVDTSLYSTGATVTSALLWGAGGPSKLNWLISDHLGTPRIILDQTGSLANVKRHDYLPFGEELPAGTGGRTTAMGYVTGDRVRQQFTSKERDNETGLDYFTHRYYSPTLGRFSSPDLPFADQDETDPQTWNLYTYVGNNPTNYTDPFGLWKKVECDNGGACWQAEDGDTWATFADATGYGTEGLKRFFVGETITSGQVFDVSGFEAWTKTQPFGIMLLRGEQGWDYSPPMGGGLRNVTKAAPVAAGLLSRIVKWFGLGKKAAPVAEEAIIAGREAYKAEVRALTTKVAEMRAAGRSVEQIAIEVHAERRALGIKYKDITPPELLKRILERNVRDYGDELGPTIKWLRDRGKTWEQIIESASRPGGQDLFQ